MAKTKDQSPPAAQPPTNGAGAMTVPQPPPPHPRAASDLSVPVPDAAAEFGTSLAPDDPRRAPATVPIIKISHKEHAFVLPSGELVASVAGYPIFYATNRAFWKRAFSTGQKDPPDCWSADNLVPHPSVENKVCTTCAACPMNQFKSGRDGKSKACSEITWTFLLNSLFGSPPLAVLMSKPSSHSILHGTKFAPGVFARAQSKAVEMPDGKGGVVKGPIKYYELVWLEFHLKPGGEVHDLLDPVIGEACTDAAKARQIGGIRKTFLDAFQALVGKAPTPEHVDEPGGSDAANA